MHAAGGTSGAKKRASLVPSLTSPVSPRCFRDLMHSDLLINLFHLSVSVFPSRSPSSFCNHYSDPACVLSATAYHIDDMPEALLSFAFDLVESNMKELYVARVGVTLDC